MSTTTTTDATETNIPVPSNEELDTTLNNMDVFMKDTREHLNEADYADKPEELKAIKGRMQDMMIEEDAKAGVDSNIALHRMLVGVNNDEDKYAMNVNLEGMRAALHGSDYTEIDKAKYGRAMQVLDSAHQKGLKVMKSATGRYWFESMETGKPVYAVNGILEVKELLDRFGGSKIKPEDTKPGTVVPEEEQEENTKPIEELTPDNYEEGFSDSDNWMLAAFGTDMVSSLAGVTAKLTGVGAPVGMGISIGGGLAAAGMSMYSDYLNDDVDTWDMWKNVGTRLGLEAVETVTVLPASLLNGIKGAGRMGRLLRKGVQVGMAAGMVDTAVGTDWLALFEKDDWDVDDYRKLAAMGQFMIGFTGSAASRKISRKSVQGNVATANQSKGKMIKQANIENKSGATVNKAKGEIQTKAAGKENAIKTKLTARKGELDTKVYKKTGKAHEELNVNAARAKGDLVTVPKKPAPKPAPAPKPKPGAKPGEQTEIDFGPAPKPKPLKPLGPEPKPATLKKREAIDKKLLADRKKLTAKKKQEFNSNESVTRSRTDKVGEIKKGVVKKQTKEFKAGEKDKNLKLVAKKQKQNKETLEESKKRIVEEHGNSIGKRLIKRGENKALGKDKADALRARAKAETKQASKQDTQMEKLKKERSALNKKKATSKKEKKVLKAEKTKKDAEIKAAEKRADSYRGKAAKLIERAKSGTVNAAGTVKSKVANAAMTPANFVIADKAYTAGVKFTHASDAVDSMSGRKKLSREEAVDVLRSLGYNGDLTKYSDKYLHVHARAAQRKVVEAKKEAKLKAKKDKELKVKSKKKVEKKQFGGTMGTMGTAIPGTFLTNFLSNFRVKLTGNSRNEMPTADPITYGMNYLSDLELIDKRDKPTLKAKATNPNTDPNAPGYGTVLQYEKPFDSSSILGEMPWEKVAREEREKQAAHDALPGAGTVLRPRQELEERAKNPPTEVVTDEEIAEVFNDIKIKAQNAINEDPENKDEIIAKYNKIIADAKKFGNSKPNGWAAAADALKHLQPSDFLSKNTIHIERPNAEDVSGVVLQSRGARNMHGFNAAQNRTSLIPRTDTADSFAANMMHKSFYNEGEKRKAELIERNAQYVEKGKDEDMNIRNENTSSAVNAENTNIQRKNQAEAIYANQLAQAKAQKQTLDNKRIGRITNGLFKGVTASIRKQKGVGIANDYNNVLALKNRWNTEFKPAFDKAVAGDKPEDIQRVKSEFVTATGYNPDDLDKTMLDIKTRYGSLGTAE